jgi:hypothetical protein
MRLPPVRFTVRRMMAAVAVVALALVSVELATSLLILAVSILAVRSRFVEPVGRRSRRWAIPYLITLTCLYLPWAWVAWDHPWEESRWPWFKSWPVSPGFTAGLSANSYMSYGEYSPAESTIALIMAAGAVFRIAVFTSLGSLGRAAMVVSSVIASLGAGLESWFAYPIYLGDHYGRLSPYRILFGNPSSIFIYEFLFFPLSGVLSVGLLLFIGHLWKRIKARRPALAPGAQGLNS